MAEEKKYIVISQKKTIAYDDTKCVIDNQNVENDDLGGKTSKQYAEEKQKEFYNSFFQKHYQNVVVLSAAGTSLDNDNGDDKSQRGKTRKDLWNACKTEIEAFVPKETDEEKDYITKGLVEGLDKKEFFSKYNYIEKKDGKDVQETYGDIEDLLSFLLLYAKTLDDHKEIDNKIKSFERTIAKNCDLILQKDAPHKEFLNKITARKPSDSRVQLFTTNYDTLFEQAANNAGFTIVDGFSYTQPRVFSGRYFDYDFVNRERTRLKNEESFVPKVFHLYKLHGSLTWEKENNRIVQKSETPKDPLIIYPASDKYESSYEQPYFEMMSRLQQALRKENVLLIIIGFGFKDKHIQSAILEAVEQNPSFQLVIVDYNGNESIDQKNLKDFFNGDTPETVKRNVTIIFDKFKDFTQKYPENETYKEELNSLNNENIR